MKGGLRAWNGLEVAGPMDLGMELLDSEAGPEDVVILSYGMEKALEFFYKSVASRAELPRAKKILLDLGGIEERHMQKLFVLYESMVSTPLERQELDSKASIRILEGGYEVEEFMEKNQAMLQTVSDILSLAMMLEAQALDLYLRYSQVVEDSKSKEVFYSLAQEEKAHLSSLGKLLEELED